MLLQSPFLEQGGGNRAVAVERAANTLPNMATLGQGAQSRNTCSPHRELSYNRWLAALTDLRKGSIVKSQYRPSNGLQGLPGKYGR
jgi:hypothetical protein